MRLINVLSLLSVCGLGLRTQTVTGDVAWQERWDTYVYSPFLGTFAADTVDSAWRGRPLRHIHDHLFPGFRVDRIQARHNACRGQTFQPLPIAF